MNKILTPPETTVFTADERHAFVDAMSLADDATVRRTIQAPDDILLDEQCRLVSNQFAFEQLALSQLCKYIATGLYTLVADIAGIRQTKRTYDLAVSIPVAVGVINACMRLRFRAVDGICGRDMIQNYQAQSVEGVVGQRYQLLPNHHLFEAVNEMVAAHTTPMEYHYGVLAGRRMAVYFITKEPVATTADGLVYAGCYFSNSEAGECAVRGATILQLGDCRCMNTLKHVSHAGKDFTKRLTNMIGGVLRTWDCTVSVGAGLGKRLQDSVTFLTPKNTINSAVKERLRAYILQYVETNIADELVRRIIYMGADGAFVPRRIKTAEIANRRVRDVAYVLMRAGRGRHPDVSERLERAAFGVVTGKLKL
jgi:hypothetical protein